MMVDFDAAVAAVQDPNADPVFLAKIAYENPEFGANVVANPRAYPGLKRWVAQFGDERARQQLVAMGWPVPQEGVMRRNTETTPEQAQQSLTQAQYQQPQQASEAQYQMQYQPPAADQYQSESFMEASASNMASDVSTEYVDPYANPADLSEVADYSSAQPQYDQPQYDGQPYADNAQYAMQPQEPAVSNSGFTAELAMTTQDKMLMAQIASEAPELHPFLARNPNIYPDLLDWLAGLNDSAVNAAIRLRQ
ncbi:hypothetical protein DW232_08355 [Bifidobacterium pseudocatenulatum]|jgi:hypothetical protein|nr:MULTISPECIES: hypothetical protein [Bifidobacterium]MDR3788176.1 hypothetical protein [Bifidobacterium sp.]QTL81320.1 hypothetical protein J7M37_07720 [Bifidobacterium pseudocatenulatum]RHG83784.1 hypothetical protein DW238_08040 [Bifidobacterium pseudocatenulatum]RHG97041.1 hypothetical protein DW232_08355 [Bifidobacterium pseudocatenulatum]RHK40861.1 hypothetical protein DW066_07195 [Bifidobacterium pseudocatenulatum]